jgi:hypothetical protein
LAGEALIPKYVSSPPLVHGVGLNRVAVPGKVPVIVAGALGSLFGSNKSRRRVLPVAGPGETVKPKSLGGFKDVGLLLPLSMHWVSAGAQYPCSGSFIIAAQHDIPLAATTKASLIGNVFIRISFHV